MVVLVHDFLDFFMSVTVTASPPVFWCLLCPAVVEEEASAVGLLLIYFNGRRPLFFWLRYRSLRMELKNVGRRPLPSLLFPPNVASKE